MDSFADDSVDSKTCQQEMDALFWELEQLEFEANKTNVLSYTSECELKAYRQLHKGIDASIVKVTKEIDDLKMKFHVEKTIRAYKEEYEAISRVINELPSRKKIASDIAVEEKRLDEAREAIVAADTKLDTRIKQFSLLMSTIQNLKATLDEDADMEEAEQLQAQEAEDEDMDRPNAVANGEEDGNMGGCCCGCRAPRRLRFVPPVVIVLLIAWLYISFIVNAQALVLAAGASITELLLFHAAVWMLVASLVRCLRTDTFAPRNKRRADATEKPAVPEDEDGAELVECKMNGERRYCRKCRAFKPDRTHHCSSCRRCVLKMDHHCVYINKCIGFYNYKFFIQFLGYSAVACLYQSSLLFRFLLQEHFDQVITLYFFGKLGFLSQSLQIVLVFFFGACLGAALLCFHGLHLFFTLRSYTTLEFCEKRRDKDFVNYYNLGMVHNIQQVFGSWRELHLWFLPVPSPSVMQSKGRYFPTNEKYTKCD
ncbi:TPA: hypothetical protein N0F65_012524 [Lagenidium giganteum]|uniref:Palmitoyltransferase n=1 Tax=Lagenidium giganteum TaxID=4803 RepID=A0AAV2YIN1_9STRA|nr:TPA: hypothetical protein N0F65_012524 [Lagenidium giganteum]